MKIYFIPSSVPELADLPKEKRDRVWLHAKRSALMREKIIWFCILLVGVSAGIGVHIFASFGLPYIGGPILAVLAWFLIQPVFIHAVLPYVRESLQKK